MRMKTFAAHLALGAAAVLANLSAAASAFPEKPITMVVSDKPGGPADVIARAVGQQLTASLRQPVVVENRPGAYFSIGLRQVARAKPDGYTVGVMFMPHTVAATLFKGTPYDIRKDFTPITKAADVFNMLVVNKALPVRSVQELADYARVKAGQLKYASGGTGTPSHLSAELFKQQASVDMLHVPFNGPVDALTNLIAGRVDLMFLSLPVAMPMVNDGKLRALAVTGDRRAMAAPAVPTMTQAGFEDFVVLDWMGIVGPAGLPGDVLARLNAEIRKALESPQVRETLKPLGMEAAPSTPAEFGALIDRETQKWQRFVERIGLSVD